MFNDLRKLGERLLFTDQTIREFERNRAKVIAGAINALSTLNVAGNLPADMITALPEYSELTEARKKVTALIDAMKAKLRSYAEDDKNDPVLVGFRALTTSARTLPTTKENVQRAHERKLLGHPPSSDDKTTIGDELIWETLLNGCTDDLVICSRDKTFHQNEPVLRGEFHSKNAKSLTVSGDLAAVVKAQGEDDSVIKKEEEALAEQRRRAAELQAAIFASAQAERISDLYSSDPFVVPNAGLGENSRTSDLLKSLGVTSEMWRESEWMRSLRTQNDVFGDSDAMKALRAYNERWNTLHNSELMKTLREHHEALETSGFAKTLRAYKEQWDKFENSEGMKALRAHSEALAKSGLAETVARIKEAVGVRHGGEHAGEGTPHNEPHATAEADDDDDDVE